MCTTMTDFNQIQELWNSQLETSRSVRVDEIIQKAENHLKKIKRDHIGTIAILVVVVAVLVAYFIWLGFSQWNLFTTGLSLMIGMLVWRIVLELVSTKRFSGIKPDGTFSEYSEKITAFYTWRKKVHVVLTPLIYLSYIAGFVMLLPGLKANLTTGFFWFCVISGSGFLVGFGIYLIHLIRKEIRMLDYLKQIS